MNNGSAGMAPEPTQSPPSSPAASTDGAPPNLQYAHPPELLRRGEPRLSKLAVAALVIACFAVLQTCGSPLAWWVDRFIPRGFHRWAILAVPAVSFGLSCFALLRILRNLDGLRGEGLAITGMVISFVLAWLTAVATAV